MYKNVHMRLVDVVSMPAKKRSIMPFKTVKYPEDKRYLFLYMNKTLHVFNKNENYFLNIRHQCSYTNCQ